VGAFAGPVGVDGNGALGVISKYSADPRPNFAAKPWYTRWYHKMQWRQSYSGHFDQQQRHFYVYDANGSRRQGQHGMVVL
jgi:hypothetical protein